MARKKYTVSIESLLEITPKELESMSRKDLAQVVTRLRDAGQKRLKRIEKSGMYSPAADYIKRTGGLQQIRGLDVTQLRSEYVRLKGLVGSKTGTVSGARRYHKAQKKIVLEMAEKAAQSRGETGGMTFREMTEHLPEGTIGKIWELIDRAAESHIITKLKYHYYVGIAIETIASAEEDDIDVMFKDFADRISKEYDKLYEYDPTLVDPSKMFNG